MLPFAIARVGMRAHSGRALAQGLTAFARAGVSSFVSKSILTVARPQAASRLLSTTSAVRQHPKEQLQAHPTHTSPPPLLSQESNALAPEFANGGLALPLDGIRILDLTRVLAGPYCTQILGDLGAEVIKVENPKGGDDTRAWGPPFAGNQHDPADRGESAYFLSVNRNKKSITVNFQTKEGQAIIHDLVKRCDILVENYVPGKLQKYGLGYEQVKELNPKLIYASITGYGQTGPYATRPGYDCIIEAEAGLMHITGESTGPPVIVGVAVIDLTTGLYAHGAIMAALLARAKTGRGQHIDCSLLDSQLATLSDIGSSYLISGQEPHRWGASHPTIVPYQAFPTRDSRIMISGGNDGQFKTLCRILGLEHLPTDIRFRTNSDRVKHRDELIKIMTERLQEYDNQHWLKAFEGQGVPFTTINDFAHTFAHPQVVARKMVQEVEHPKAGKLKLIGIPVKYSESKPSVRLPPPLLGQHTQEILRDVLHYGAEKVDSLAAAGAI
ncbi:hypothetical protein BGZ95_001150 [Linnemannia exigua]|uniref:CoA-transferase family III n=1 Tax=Linnemannia exigua TaxID=604196 RepID=A0AAD4D797_9FUNG|nr:hypothetical protein BGZ95_001150 [Linnemannia exigua]